MEINPFNPLRDIFQNVLYQDLGEIIHPIRGESKVVVKLMINCVSKHVRPLCGEYVFLYGIDEDSYQSCFSFHVILLTGYIDIEFCPLCMRFPEPRCGFGVEHVGLTSGRKVFQN